MEHHSDKTVPFVSLPLGFILVTIISQTLDSQSFDVEILPSLRFGGGWGDAGMRRGTGWLQRLKWVHPSPQHYWPAQPELTGGERTGTKPREITPGCLSWP